ncbi:MAG: hypothetical protein ACKVOE_04540 [Rickettsiales bacterium]
MGLFIEDAACSGPLWNLIRNKGAICFAPDHITITFAAGVIEKAEERAEQGTGERPDYRAQLKERFPGATIEGNIVELSGENAIKFEQMMQPVSPKIKR